MTTLTTPATFCALVVTFMNIHMVLPAAPIRKTSWHIQYKKTSFLRCVFYYESSGYI